MRPLALRVAGLRSYRHEVDVQLEGRGLVAIVGDTGSGKSSLLEAIVYALYNRSSFEGRSRDLIARDRTSMEVSLDFAARGRRYRVTRSRNADGYPPPRHGLVCLDDPAVEPVDGEVAVTAEIERLVGFGCDAFLKTVLLPQGRFADLLRATGTERTRILRDIFRLGRLESVRERTRGVRDRADESLAPLVAERAGLPDDPDAELAGRRAERAAAEGAHESLSRAARDHDSALRAADVVADRAAGARSVQRGLDLEAGVEALMRLERAQLREEELDQSAAGTADELAAIQRQRAERQSELASAAEDGLGPDELTAARVRLDAVRDRARSLAARQSEVDRLTQELEIARAAAAESGRVWEGARAAAARAAAEHDRAADDARVAAERARKGRERSAVAHGLLHDHREGDPCPVCRQTLPAELFKRTETAIAGDRGAAPGVDDRAVQAARARAEEAESASVAAEAAASEDLRAVTARAAALDAETLARDREREALAAARDALPLPLRPPYPPSDDAVAAAFTELERRHAALAQLRHQIEELVRRREGLEAVRHEQEAARRELVAEPRTSALRGLDHLHGSCRRAAELLGEEEPAPVPESTLDDELRCGRALVELASRLAEDAAALGERADNEGRAARERARRVLDAVRQPTGKALLDARDAAAGARSAAAAALARVERDAPRARELDRATVPGLALVADLKALERTLSPSAFPRHASTARQAALLSVASKILGNMTGGRFGFSADFEIYDAVVGGQRGVRTLSGGETFLASLALSLALVELADRSGGRVDALFLDEGFGQLDADALDSALTELERRAQGGRLVGVVSHVYAVAERIDDVLHVRDDGTGASTVEWLSPAGRQSLLDQDAARLIAI